MNVRQISVLNTSFQVNCPIHMQPSDTVISYPLGSSVYQIVSWAFVHKCFRLRVQGLLWNVLNHHLKFRKRINHVSYQHRFNCRQFPSQHWFCSASHPVARRMLDFAKQWRFITNGNPVAKLFYQLMNNLGKRACSTICKCINIDYFRQLLLLCKDSDDNVQKERLNLALSK